MEQELCVCIARGNWCHHWVLPPWGMDILQPRARGDRVGWCSQLPKLPRIGLLPYKAGDNGSYRQPAEHTRGASFHTEQQERGILSLSTSLPISSWLVRFPVKDRDGLAPLTDLSQDRAVENGICRSSLAAKITQKSSFTLGNWRKWELPLGHWAAWTVQ